MTVGPLRPREPLKGLLEPENEADAVALLTEYFDAPPRGKFSGSRFELLAGGGDRPEVADKFTADDLVAVSTLAVSVKGDAALALLEHRSEEFGALLAAIPVTDRLADLPADALGESWPVRALYRKLMGLPHVGVTTATKLMARKRPHLVPIMDTVVERELEIVKENYWRPLHAWLTADGKTNHRQLERLHDAAGLPANISTLRVFDVLVWRVGMSRARR